MCVIGYLDAYRYGGGNEFVKLNELWSQCESKKVADSGARDEPDVRSGAKMLRSRR